MKKNYLFKRDYPSPAYLVFFSLFVMLLVLLVSVSCTSSPTTAVVNSIPITIETDGKQIALQVPAGTTSQGALDQAGISLGNLDRVEPPSYQILNSEETISVTRVREVFTVQENTIPFEQETLNNETLPEGRTLLVQPGVNGTERITYRQVFENDLEVSNVVFQTETIVEPLPEIIMVGVQKPFSPITIPGKLAYLAGGSAWVMESSTGNRRPIVTTGDLDGRVFSLSPKGDWLLFTRSERQSDGEIDASDGKINSLWAVDLSEEAARPINLKVDNVYHFADWVPDKGLTITYSTVEPRSTAPGWQANNDLQMLTFAPTGTVIEQETILETNAGGLYGWWGTDYAWSPDGALLAYSRPDSVGLVDIQNKSLVPLVDILPFQTGSAWAWVSGVGWSPDHNVLFLVTHAPKPGLENPEESPLFDLSGLAISSEPLSPGGPLIGVVPQAGMFASPVPSPMRDDNGYNVAYLQAIFPEQSDSKRYRLALMDRDGSNRTVIFPPADRQGLDPQQVAWSPDDVKNGNLWLAVNYQGNLWLIDATTGETEQVTGDGLLTHFDWK